MTKITETKNSKYVNINCIDLSQIKLNNSLLQQRREINHKNSLYHQYEKCEKTGKIDNFRIAVGWLLILMSISGLKVVLILWQQIMMKIGRAHV